MLWSVLLRTWLLLDWVLVALIISKGLWIIPRVHVPSLWVIVPLGSSIGWVARCRRLHGVSGLHGSRVRGLRLIPTGAATGARATFRIPGKMVPAEVSKALIGNQAFMS